MLKRQRYYAVAILFHCDGVRVRSHAEESAATDSFLTKKMDQYLHMIVAWPK